MTDVAPGTYRISAEQYFQPVQGGLYGYYRGTNLSNSADIVVKKGKTTPDINIVISDNYFDGKITGKVTVSDTPQSGIVVNLHVSNYGYPVD
jgi:hypothetical protein